MLCPRFTCMAGMVAVLALGACGDPVVPASPAVVVSDARVHQVAAGTPLKLAFITNNISEFWKVAEKGVEKANVELGITVDVLMPETGRPEQQNRIIADLIRQGYHGVAISLISPADQTWEIDQASEKLNVITHDSDGPRSKRLAYIGTNNYEAGKVLGNELKKLLPRGGKVAAFVGTLAADNASQRLKGVQDALAGSKVEVVLTKEDNRDPVRARANVEAVITASPDITAFIGLWSYNTPAIIAAVKASGKADKLLVAGFDQEDATLQGIEDGVVKLAIVQKPFDFGYRSAVLLHALASTGAAALPVNPIIDTGVEVVTKDNVAAFRRRVLEQKK